jgi:1,4-alpha-glucan branching enzyme
MILLPSASKSWRALFINQTRKETEMNASLNESNLKELSIPFTFPAPAARQVTLAGDFNQWDPKTLPMRKDTHGVWHLSVALKPGRHEYRFIADGVWTDDPTAKQRTANAMGSENCIRTVGRKAWPAERSE